MDTNLLSTFIEVANTNHFGKAAENLYVTQSTVSSRIQLLEAELDSRLFDRSSKSITLTKEGQRFLEHAKEILMVWKNAKQDLHADSENYPLLTIASTPGLWNYIFSDNLPNLLKDKDACIKSLSFPKEDIQYKLFNNEIDLALNYSSINQTGWQVSSLGIIELGMVVAKKYAEQFSIESTAYVHVDWGEDFNLFVDRKFSDKNIPFMYSDNAFVAQRVLQNMQSCAYLPKKVVDINEDLQFVSSKLAPVFKRKVYASYSKTHEHAKLLKRIVAKLEIK
jgi:DNA-binding transcriptional LysR family regulator